MATSAMQKNYHQSSKAMIDAHVDPTLFESNCYHHPKIDKHSAKLAEQGRKALQEKYKMQEPSIFAAEMQMPSNTVIRPSNSLIINSNEFGEQADPDGDNQNQNSNQVQNQDDTMPLGDS